ncbi:MAG: glycoside hydrolase family 97 catalytic domain-containing protein [Myxococcota bacterium]
MARRFVPSIRPVAVFCALLCVSGCGDSDGRDLEDSGPHEVASPDGTVRVIVERRDLSGTADFPAGDAWYYRIEREGTEVLGWSPLGLRTSRQELVAGLRFVSEERQEIAESYETTTGKRRMRDVRGNELTLHLEGSDGTPLDVIVRAHDDGAAFRYVLGGEGEATMESEATGFAVPDGATGWLALYDELGLGLFAGGYENPYHEVTAGEPATDPAGTPNDDGWQFPALFEVHDGAFVLLTESDLDGTYCGTRLAGDPVDAVYRIRFPSEEEGRGVGEVQPTSTRPWTTPWRVIIVGDLPTVVESTLVDDLARPSVLSDARWITPGRVAWSWFTQGTGDEALQREYLAFAAEMGWEHLLIDANWNEWPDAQNAMPQLVEDAAAAGVNVHLWYNSGGEHSSNPGEEPADLMHEPEVRRAEMQMLEEWGVAGVKIDFFNSDKQDRIQQYVGILEDAAEHGLLVNLHGATLPRGWQRTYPNLMTHEAVRGAEFAMFEMLPSQLHRVRYVLARNVVGSMDYTPVTFQSSLEAQGIPYAAELALAVAFESGLQHFADNGDADPATGYRAVFDTHPFAKTFLQEVPAAWDETRLLEGHPSSHVVIARRHGARWYVAALWGREEEGTVRVPLSFLQEGDHATILIREGAAADEMVQETATHTPADTLEVPVGPGGGFVAWIDPA